MKALSALWFSLRSLVRRRRADSEIDEELAFHLEREAALYERQGMSAGDARREAVRHFGGVQRHREECQDVRRTRWFDDLRADLRFAIRLIRHYPGFSANVILISALGITVCAATFSVVSGVLFSPLPFSSPDRVAVVEFQSRENTSAAVPVDAYLRLAAGTPVFDAVAASKPSGATIEVDGEPVAVRTALVTPSFFRVFGVSPVLGRSFGDDEATQRAPVAMLGYAAWRSRFKAEPGVVGRRLVVDDVSYTIVGVLPPRFRAHFAVDPELWLPMTVPSAIPAEALRPVNAIVRIAPGVTRLRAGAWLRGTIQTRIQLNTYTDSLPAVGSLVPITYLVYGYVQKPLLVLGGAVLLVLLLVAANVAALFLARTSAREGELGMRRALGASAGRQIRQLVTESLTLTAVGGALGVVVSYWVVGSIRDLGLRVLPRMDAVWLDWRVLLFAAAATMLTGVAGGLAPAFSSRRDAAGLSDASTTRVTSHRVSSALVVAQIALSVTLLVGAGLLVKGFLRVLPTDGGVALDHRSVLSVELRDRIEFPAGDTDAPRRFVRDVIDGMSRVNGVREVAAASFLPFTGTVSFSKIEITGRSTAAPADSFVRRDKSLMAFRTNITPNYLDVMRIPLLRGRGFRPADDDGAAPVVIINETAARLWWPGENAVGRQLTFSEGLVRHGATVVGVARGARLFGTDTTIQPEMYVPVAQSSMRWVSFVAHTSVEPRTVERDLERAIWRVAPRLPIGTVSDLATIAATSVGSARFFSTAMTVFAATAVALSALGVYSLLAFAVAQRRREIGIRIALGAPTRRISLMILGRAVSMGVAGVIIGIVFARALSHYMQSLLVEVTATDGTVFGLAAAGMLLIAAIAGCAPTYRAIRTDPITSLRVQ